MADNSMTRHPVRGIATVLALVLALVLLPEGRANPEGGTVVFGDVRISQPDPVTLRVDQTSDRSIIEWNSFSIAAGETAVFNLPSAGSASLNRVVGGDLSSIAGRLVSNGQVFLINPNGILFTKDAQVSVGGLVASTLALEDAAFREGRLEFHRDANSSAAPGSIRNDGTITAADGGLVGLVAPEVTNSGVIAARAGTIVLASGEHLTLDLHGDGLVSFAAPAPLAGPGGDAPARQAITNTGAIEGATVVLSAKAARNAVDAVISTGGSIVARTARAEGGRIILDGGAGTVKTAGIVSADGANGGTIEVSGNALHLDGRVTADGSSEAPRSGPQVDRSRSDRHRSRTLDLQFEDLGSTGEVSEGGKGGTIKVEGGAFTSLDGMLSASAWSGGSILTTATRNFALNGQVMANGAGAQGGRVSITAGGETWEGSGSGIDVSGATGGTITNITQGKFVTSAHYLAAGWGGAGGKIDVTGGDMFLLSSTYDASGLTGGGTVRLGGEFQGGKALATDEIPNARKLAANDGVKIDVSAKGNHGDAGTAIIWSDQKTTFLGSVYATGGLLSGVGGLVEASSADSLIWRGTVETAVNGERGGTLLLDPKNITIADASFSQLQLILGAFAAGPGEDSLDNDDAFGTAVSLDGTRLAVGASRDDGATNSCTDCGAAYLFTFTDTAFSGGTLAARIGHGYSGGKNVNLAGPLGTSDQFGTSVSLDGTRLAVGAMFDNGATNNLNGRGAVYLFTFTDTAFSGGTLVARIGAGYTGDKDINLAVTLENFFFGSAVSLDGNRLAVGARSFDGATSACDGCGDVYLFTFTDTAFSGGALAARIGDGFTGGNNVNMAGMLESGDNFGYAVSLDGTRLAVGAVGDDGVSNGCGGCGAVYIFTFTDTAFSGGTLAWRIGDNYIGFVNGIKNLNLGGGLDSADFFGSAVSLDGTRLAVGAYGDDGNTNNCGGCGAVWLFNFSDTDLSAHTDTSRIGHNYTGGSNINLAGTLGFPDEFGRSVSLDGTRLAVGSFGDAGASNSCSTCGGVYLFTFADTAFSGGTLAGRIGDGYTGGNNINLAGALNTPDYFGRSVSLDGARLAVGALEDDGVSNGCGGCGAVYFFSFTDINSFSGGSLSGRAGSGYTGGNNIDLSAMLNQNDWFGYDVALDGSRLAVGAAFDDGIADTCDGCGGVYLFTFASGTSFDGGALTGRIGAGYLGANDTNLSGILGASDGFGQAVSLDGTSLAVGARYDDGFAGNCQDCGAVYLITFADNLFSGGGALAGIIGHGYSAISGTSSINLDGFSLPALEAFDVFGTSVSLSGNRLAVGAESDDGVNGLSCIECGAVYMFRFADSDFALGGLGGPLAGRIGAIGNVGGYSSADDVDISSYLGLDSDHFGSSVSLDGNRLAVGANQDSGFNNLCPSCGAVYLFTLSDDVSFSGGVVHGRIGHGYVGTNDIDLSGSLGGQDGFGSSVSLYGTGLVVGAPYDDGATNSCNNCGAAYLFTLGGGSPVSGNSGFGDNAASDVTISPTALTALLNAGTSVTLQASNDITVNSAITAANPSGSGGSLTLQAGRSIFVNANIFTDDGNLTLIANDLLANGVVDAYRDAGAAAITMATGTSINAGSGSVLFDMRSGAGKTNATGGAITLTSVTGGTITAQNASASNGDIVLAAGASLTASGAGNAVVLAAGDQFINNAGTTPIATPSGRFMIYSQNWGSDTRGGIAANNLYNRTYGANPPASVSQTGNLFIYAAQPLLTVTANAASRTYGAANPAFSATITGLVNGDSAAYAYTGTAGFSTTTTDSSNVGTYVGDILPSLGSLVSSVGYGFSYAGGNLTIDQAPLTVTASNATKTYGQTASLTNFTTSGLLFSDSVTGLSLSSLGSLNTANVGAYAITASGATGTGLGNYNITYANGSLTVNPAALTVTASNASKTYGQTASLSGFTTSGLLFSDSVTGVSLSSTGSVNTANVGSYAITASGATGTGLGNYNITYANGSLTVNPAALTVTAGNASKTYGQTASLTNFTTSGLLFSDSVTGVTLSSLGVVNTANVGAYAITASGATGTGLGNYNITYANGSLTVNPAALTVTASNATKTYGQTASLTNFTTSGLLFSDSVTGLSLSSLGSVNTANVGAYAITASGATGTGLGNYTITYANGTLGVDPAALTVTANNGSKTFGQSKSFAGTEFTPIGLLFSDSVTGVSLSSPGAASTANAGSYAINVANAVGTGLGNYIISYVPGTLSVGKALLEVYIQDTTYTVGSALFDVEVEVLGFLPGDSVTNVLVNGKDLLDYMQAADPKTGQVVIPSLFDGNLSAQPASTLVMSVNTSPGLGFDHPNYTVSNVRVPGYEGLLNIVIVPGNFWGQDLTRGNGSGTSNPGNTVVPGTGTPGLQVLPQGSTIQGVKSGNTGQRVKKTSRQSTGSGNQPVETVPKEQGDRPNAK